MNSDFEWQFGGWLRQLPVGVAWGILGLVTLVGLVAIVLLYRRTLRKLPQGSRVALTVLRVALLLVLCVVLANPSRVSRPPDDANKNGRHLAVIVDRSGSMYTVDNRNETRLQNAVKLWKTHTGEAVLAFDAVDHYRFATKLEKVASLDEAIQGGGPGTETRLWRALRAAMADSPAGIVTLTDGLDTSGHDANQVITEAQARGIPLYFVPGMNRSRPGNLLAIRDVKTPSTVLRLSKFNASAILEISSPRDRDVPVALWSGSKMLAQATLHARPGWNVLPWTPEVSSGEPGALPLEFRLGEGAEQETAASVTQVVEHTSVEILYYQGALQWGYRFLRGALESDQSFKLTSILNPALGVRITASAGTTLEDLPDNAGDLKRFQIVILAHVLADQLSAKQQQALVDYAKGGGGVLFIAPDSEATNRFAGTPLEEMLPIVFERSDESPEQREAEAFQAKMQQAFESSGQDAALADGAGGGTGPQLVPFQVPQGSESIFKANMPVPMFSNYARVASAKPAAEILAVHPTERTADNAPRILLARQQFGAGFTAAMATDLLWRWKMSLPSDSRAPETFWQQLMLSLVPGVTGGEGMRIVKQSSTAAVNRGTSLIVTGAPAADPPVIVAIPPAGQTLTLTPVASPDGWQASFTPNVQGRWELMATDSKGNRASMSLPVQSDVVTAENSNAPPDVEGLRHIADATGGAVIGSDPVFQPQDTTPAAGTEAKIIQPMWNQSWLLALLLGLYVVELITRRVMRLL